MDEAGLESVNTELEVLQELFEEAIFRCQGWGRNSSIASSSDLTALTLIKQDLESMSRQVRQLASKSHAHQFGKESLLERVMQTRVQIRRKVQSALSKGHGEKETLQAALKFVQPETMSSSDSESEYDNNNKENDKDNWQADKKFASKNEHRSPVHQQKQDFIAAEEDKTYHKISPSSVLPDSEFDTPPAKSLFGSPHAPRRPVHELFHDPLSSPQQEFLRGYANGGAAEYHNVEAEVELAIHTPPSKNHWHSNSRPYEPSQYEDVAEEEEPLQAHASVSWQPTTNQPILEVPMMSSKGPERELSRSGDPGAYMVEFDDTDRAIVSPARFDQDAFQAAHQSTTQQTTGLSWGKVLLKCAALAAAGSVVQHAANQNSRRVAVHHVRRTISHLSKLELPSFKRSCSPPPSPSSLHSTPSTPSPTRHTAPSHQSALQPSRTPSPTKARVAEPARHKPPSPSTRSSDFNLPNGLPRCRVSERRLPTVPRPAPPPAPPRRQEVSQAGWTSPARPRPMNVLVGRG